MSNQDKSQEELLAEMAWIKRQRQSKLFRGSEEPYYHLFRDSAVGMAVVMPDGRITQSNKAFCDFLGYSEPELFGKTILSMMHPDDREASSKTVMQSLASGLHIQHFDQRYLHTSGQVVWGEVSTTMICDAEGKLTSAIVQVSDITERKQAEEALLEREAQLVEAQEVAHLGSYVLDLSTGRWRSSSVLDIIFGIPGDYERTVAGWAELIHPEERQEMLDYFLQDVVGEKKRFDREYRIVRYSDKQVQWVHGHGRLRFNEDGH